MIERGEYSPEECEVNCRDGSRVLGRPVVHGFVTYGCRIADFLRRRPSAERLLEVKSFVHAYDAIGQLFVERKQARAGALSLPHDTRLEIRLFAVPQRAEAEGVLREFIDVCQSLNIEVSVDPEFGRIESTQVDGRGRTRTACWDGSKWVANI